MVLPLLVAALLAAPSVDSRTTAAAVAARLSSAPPSRLSGLERAVGPLHRIPETEWADLSRESPCPGVLLLSARFSMTPAESARTIDPPLVEWTIVLDAPRVAIQATLSSRGTPIPYQTPRGPVLAFGPLFVRQRGEPSGPTVVDWHAREPGFVLWSGSFQAAARERFLSGLAELLSRSRSLQELAAAPVPAKAGASIVGGSDRVTVLFRPPLSAGDLASALGLEGLFAVPVDAGWSSWQLAQAERVPDEDYPPLVRSRLPTLGRWSVDARIEPPGPGEPDARTSLGAAFAVETRGGHVTELRIEAAAKAPSRPGASGIPPP